MTLPTHLQPLSDTPWPDESREYPIPLGWPDYITKYGITRKDIPHLIQMMAEPATGWDDPTWIACTRARRLLTQLRAVEAAPALLEQLESTDEVADDFGEVAAAVVEIRQATFPLLLARIDANPNAFMVLDALAECGRQDPAYRDRVVATLVALLATPEQIRATNRACILCSLVDLDAREHVDLIYDELQRLRNDAEFEFLTVQWDQLWGFINVVQSGDA